MSKIVRIKWEPEIEADDYPAARSYLNLIYPHAYVDVTLEHLHRAKITGFKAKDIFRASQLSLLGISNDQVKKNLKKIQKGVALSPLLLLRDTNNGKVIIADGYHRLCAIYKHNENTLIHCKIV